MSRRALSMSLRIACATPAAAPNALRRVRIPHLHEMKQRGERWAMLTAYDMYSAQVFDEAAAYASLNQTELTIEDAERVLGDIVKSGKRQVTPTLILETTAARFNFTVKELQAQDRRRPLVMARQIAMYLFRELTDLSYPEIAKEFGGRDHTTIIYGCDKIKALMKERHSVYDDVTTLIHEIKSG